jgi:hypothetical protein
MQNKTVFYFHLLLYKNSHLRKTGLAQLSTRDYSTCSEQREPHVGNGLNQMRFVAASNPKERVVKTSTRLVR